MPDLFLFLRSLLGSPGSNYLGKIFWILDGIIDHRLATRGCLLSLVKALIGLVGWIIMYVRLDWIGLDIED